MHQTKFLPCLWQMCMKKFQVVFLGQFSKLKFINGSNFKKFKEYFNTREQTFNQIDEINKKCS